MTDETPRTPPPALPTAEEEVRRLLADARHTDPMPDEVVARLDRVLAGLGDEPAREAPVIALAQRRRRATALLVAAAAVVAVGLGLNELINPNGLSAGQSASDGTAVAPREMTDERGVTSSEEEAAPEVASGGAGSARTEADDRDGLLDLRSQNFADKLRDRQAKNSDLLRSGYLADLSAADAAGKACGSDAWGAGRFVPVRYEGRPAVVVLRRPQGDTQVADLFVCGDTVPTRTVTLPAP